jgi:glycosyltransferase involved in cell wall biosynthesis
VKRQLQIDGAYILYVGTLQPRKNLVRLIEAYGRLIARWSDEVGPPSLVLAGQSGWLSEGIFRAVDRLGLAGRVKFPGYVPDADLPALLSGASAFAFPSLYEGFGFPVLEAMACQVPVVCSNTSSLPEVAGDAALLVNPLDVEELANALHAVLIEPMLRARLIEAGEQQVTRFSWERAARETLTALEEAATR